jgi:hypothetical protein
MIIQHIFYFIIPFSCQNLSSIHAFVLHTNGLEVDADYIPQLLIVEKKRTIILNDRLFYFLSTAIVILIVIVITIKLYHQKNEIYWQNVFKFNHSPIAINSLITQSACVYLDLLPLILIYIKYLKLLTLEKPILIFHFYK